MALRTRLIELLSGRDRHAPPSRAVVVLGMHRSGTSAVARGLAALGVYLGNDLLDAHPENPTGYWEDRGIVERNERILKTLVLRWDDVRPIAPAEFERRRIAALRRESIAYLRRRFTPHALWGFKDPRTIRLLPFWTRVMRDAGVDDAYLLAIRNPSSVAASLFARQAMDVETAGRLWLVHVVPFLDRVAGKALAVVDYDLLLLDPRRQLERVAQRLGLPYARATHTTEVERFANDFLDAGLRHTRFGPDEIDAGTEAGRLTREAYALLYELAEDRGEASAEFWSAWERIAAACRTRLAWPSIK